MVSSRHVAVVGGGIVGLSCAWQLLERGHRVTLLERGGPEHDSCSVGNAGYISPSHIVPLSAPGIVKKALRWMGDPESPFYVHPRPDPGLIAWGIRFARAARPEPARRAGPILRDLSLRSKALFEDLAARTGNEFELVREGLLTLFRTQAGLDHEAAVAAYARELGMPGEVLDARGVAALEPDAAFDVVGGVFYPQDAHVTPQRLIPALTRLVAERGGAFVWNAELRGWRTEGDAVRAARTLQGEYAADEFVVAAGSWTPLLVRGLGVAIPLQPGKGYSLTHPAPRQRIRRSIILAEGRVALTPMGTALRVGGTMEMTGYDLSINPPRIRGILKSLTRYLPQFRAEDFAGLKPWCGLRPCSPDGLPYVGRARRYSNLTVAAGHAMMGLTLGPVTGELVAQVLSGETPSVNMDPLCVERFG
jgi:D-amino-acid dehydrogenase